jgi:hypothetical protein
MAQAPDAGGGGAPRQNKTVKQFGGMNTQNQRNAVPEGSFSWLENIQPIGPGNLHSIPGRGLALTTIPPAPPPPVGCPEDTAPTGPQSLSIVHCYDYNEENNAGQVNFVTGDPTGSPSSDSFLASLSIQSGFGVVYPAVGNPKIFQANGHSISTIPTQTLPFAAKFVGQSSHAGMSGHSDELSIRFDMFDFVPASPAGPGDGKVYFNYEDGTATILNYLNAVKQGAWAKRGTRFWNTSGAPHTVERYAIPTGGYPVATVDLVLGTINENDAIMSYSATDNFLYMLYRDDPPGTTKLFRLDLDTMAIIDEWQFTDPVFGTAKQMFAVSDDLIYLFVPSTNWTFGYFQPQASPPVPVVIDSLDTGCISPLGYTLSGQVGFHFNKGYFYLTYGGAGTGFTNTVKIGPLVCPGTDIPIGT